MPTYLAPGVYVEETSYRSKLVEGVSTSTAGFLGPARYGPVRGVPEILTSVADFQRIYGGIEPLVHGDTSMTNFLGHAVRNFLNEGGSRLYVARTFLPNSDEDTGIASYKIGTIKVHARYPGQMGNMRVTFTLRVGQNVVGKAGRRNVLRGVNNYDLVWVTDARGRREDVAKQIFWVEELLDGKAASFILRQGSGADAIAIPLSAIKPDEQEVRVLSLDVACAFPDTAGTYGPDQLWSGLSLHPSHPSALSVVFAAEPCSRATELYVPLVITRPDDPCAGILNLLSHSDAGPAIPEGGLSVQFVLTGGNDGQRPTSAEYAGDEGAGHGGRKSGLYALQDEDDIAIVAAPGATYGGGRDWTVNAMQVSKLLLAHCESMRYRVAVLDAPDGMTVGEVRNWRAQLDSSYGALYYPWVQVMDPVTQAPISLPPSGFVAGIWVRSDNNNGVHKAPANEVVRTALGLETMLNKAQQELLNPEGINCFRYFEGRGILLWGARTVSSDSAWKYVNLRRYFAYLEHSLDRGTQWAVFESNGPTLWEKVRTTVSDFLYNEWKMDRLLGAKPEEAYFVRCDESTMTQNDLDNGRLVCRVGVAPLRPAEFVVVRIGQWTASK